MPDSDSRRTRRKKTTWEFQDPANPVVGMYGKTNSDDEIVQLGWL